MHRNSHNATIRMLKKHMTARLPAYLKTRALKRLETPEDLLGPLVYLASSESDFVTGQTLLVDGGSVFY
jgi:NAD(P)-dependent dehydrogenase (short-subunit alcohol dehydrogenase family)